MSAALFQRAWRWHFLAAALVVPFVLWQSVTGTVYLWADAWADARHPALRFVVPPAQQAQHAPLDAQLAAARAAYPQLRVQGITVPDDARRSTLVLFGGTQGLPHAAFVNPYTGALLGTLDGAAWPAGWSRRLHGGWPLGAAGSWLLELGACWTIVMVLTGLYLWWPRDGRGLRAVLLPRLRGPARQRWRDLHACVAVWFSALIVAFLLTALPWTDFWGGRVLTPLMRVLGQQAPPAAGFAPLPAPANPGTPLTLQALVDRSRVEGLAGELRLSFVDGPPDRALGVRTVRPRAADERYVQLARGDGAPVARADWADFPPLARAVATGVDLHEGSFFGRAGPWLNTALAGVLVWVSVTGTLAWWRRRPAGAVGVPARAAGPVPRWVGAGLAVLCAALPLLAVSLGALWLGERMWAAAVRRHA